MNARLVALVALLLALAPLPGCRPHAPAATAPELSFWVWGRDVPPSTEERTALHSAGVSRVYWQIGELEGKDGRLVERSRFPLPAVDRADGIVWIPVIRIASGTVLPEQVSPRDAARWARQAGVTTEVQFDYDCADRRLPDYAAWLRAFRSESGVKKLSSTALGGWAKVPGWREVEAAIDEAFPMLYDVTPERAPRPDLRPDAEPLLNPAYVKGLLRDWSRCRVPWRAGLPNFSRISLFRAGRALGQIRSWTWEAMLDDALWEPIPTPDAPVGIQFLRSREMTTLGGLWLQPGDVLAVKQCDPSALREVLEALPASTAQGVVWFQMPRPDLAASGWSLAMTASGFRGTPLPTWHWMENRLVLENGGDGDFGPLLPGGHELRLQVPAGSIAEGLPGDFSSLTALRDGRPVPVSFATEIVLRFARLPAGSSLRSGPLLPFAKNLAQTATLDHNPLQRTPE